MESYDKAIQLLQDGIQNGKEKDAAKANQKLSGFYTNLADAYARDHKIDDAVKSYEAAAKADPTAAASAYFNIGAVYTNAGRVDDANAAFDKCIAADPNRAEAYYQKGVNLLGKATLQGTKRLRLQARPKLSRSIWRLPRMAQTPKVPRTCWRALDHL